MRLIRDGARPDDGYTVMEIMVASAILMVALAVFLGGLASTQQTASYESHRTRALDDLRITADVFAKDARHAIEVRAATEDRVEMTTFVGGAETTVTYRVVTTDGETNLERLELGGDPRLFVIRLTTDSIFTYTPDAPTFPHPDPDTIRMIGIHMETRPQPQYPPVVLETEVSLRNVRAT